MERITPEPNDKMEAFVQHATRLSGELYKMMAPGMTIELLFPAPESNIVVPNQPKPSPGKLIITKPASNLQIQVENK